MKTITFAEVPLNGNFLVIGGVLWCNKIDDARYIVIGQNGTVFPPDRDMKVYVEG